MTELYGNFTYEEAVKSQIAIRQGINNTPNAVELEKLKLTAKYILQPTRDHYCVAIVPSSWFRTKELCLALYNNPDLTIADITSQHAEAEAVDFEVPGVSNLDLATWIHNNLDYDKLILEYHVEGEPSSGWVHVSYRSKERNRKLAYIYSGGDYKPWEP